MTIISVSFERFAFGNEHWRAYRAMDEIEIYCDLLENLQDRIDSLETRGKDEEVTLCNVQAVISSYAFEIAMKSLWALDNPSETVPPTHDLPTILDGLGSVHTNSAEMLSSRHGDYRSSVRTHSAGPAGSARQRQTAELAGAQRDPVCRRAGLQVARAAAPLRQLAYRLHTDEPLVEEWGARPGV